MKFYPYSKIRSENLKPLLFAARSFGVLGFILFALLIVVAGLGIAIDQPATFNIGNAKGTMSGPGTTIPAIVAAIWGGILSVGILAFSGLCAAVVSFDYKYTNGDTDQDLS